MTRKFSFTLLLALGAAWAGMLVVIGLLVATGGAPGWITAGGLARRTGATAVLAGEFVFLVVVADHMFPNTVRWLTGAVEAIVGIAMAVSMAGVVASLLSGGA